MSILLLGVGSPFGADSLGWEALDYLRECLPSIDGVAVECERLAHPSALYPLLAGRDGLVVLDGLLGVEAGSLQLLSIAELKGAERASSHQLGVAEALALASATGDLPERVAIIGIGAGEGVAAPDGGWRGPLLSRLWGLLDAWGVQLPGSPKSGS